MRRFGRRDREEYDNYERDTFEKRDNNFDNMYDANDFINDELRGYREDYSRREPRMQEDYYRERNRENIPKPNRRYDEPSRKEYNDRPVATDYEDRRRYSGRPQQNESYNRDRYDERETQKNESERIKEMNTGTNNVVVSSPKNYGDVQHLIDNLRNKQAVIVDIAKIDPRDAQRILDFLSGAIYALGGSQQRIAKTIFLLTPGGITIKIPYDIKERLERDN